MIACCVPYRCLFCLRSARNRCKLVDPCIKLGVWRTQNVLAEHLCKKRNVQPGVLGTACRSPRGENLELLGLHKAGIEVQALRDRSGKLVRRCPVGGRDVNDTRNAFVGD